MSVRDWFRRHGNVLSISTRSVKIEPGDQGMLLEEYGSRAGEERTVSHSDPLAAVAPATRMGVPAPGFLGGVAAHVSGDGILENGEDGVGDGKPPPNRAP